MSVHVRPNSVFTFHRFWCSRSAKYALCKLIEDAFRTERERTFIFEFAAHVLSNGGTAVCSNQLIRSFPGAPQDHVTMADLLGRADCLFDRTAYRFGPNGAKPRSYSIRKELRHLITGTLQYESWSKFRNRKPWRCRPFPFRKANFLSHTRARGTIANLSPTFLTAMAKLSNRPIIFDRDAALRDPDLLGEMQPYALPHGQIYTSYFMQLSGRIGTQRPNLQGIKRSLRKHIHPSGEGNCHLYFDYSSQEPRLLAYLSGDRDLGCWLYQGIYETAMQQFRLPERDMAKQLINSMIYGTPDLALSMRLFGTAYPTKDQIKEAHRLQSSLRCAFPQALDWIDLQKQAIIKAGKAVTIGGTVRTAFERNLDGRINAHSARRAGVNHLIQGAGADILRLLVERLDHLLEPVGAFLALPVHDGLLIETPRTSRTQTISLVIEAMRSLPQEILPGIDLPVDVKDQW